MYGYDENDDILKVKCNNISDIILDAISYTFNIDYTNNYLEIHSAKSCCSTKLLNGTNPEVESIILINYCFLNHSELCIEIYYINPRTKNGEYSEIKTDLDF